MTKREDWLEQLSSLEDITENHLQQFRQKVSEEEFEKSLDIPNDLKLFNSAEEYRKSAEYLIKKPSNHRQELYIEHVRAYLLCLSFSLELYVKCLLEIKNKNSHGHVITDLFKKFDVKTRQEVSSLYGMRTKSQNLSEDEFRKVLQKVNNLFVEWRYIHEKKTSEYINIEVLWWVINCFREYILRIKNKTQ